MKQVRSFIFGTAILWLPILGIMIASKLAQMITMDMILNLIYISIPVLIISLIKMEIEEIKVQRRKRNGQAR